MPIYEYTCETCGRSTEAIRKMADADAPIACEHCGGGQTHRAHSVFMARSGADSQGHPLPMAPCGRCGDPGGSCGM
jgi:putative FmdB family regulatory protein